MNINHELLFQIEGVLPRYECPVDSLRSFLLDGLSFEQRQTKAKEIIGEVLAVHAKKRLLPQVAELARVESGIGELQPWVRDHVVHAVLSFALGVYLNERYMPAGAIREPLQWKIAGLLHDVGYPLEIAMNVARPYGDVVRRILGDLNVRPHPLRINVIPKGLERLFNGVNAFDLIGARLAEWQLAIDPRKVYRKLNRAGKVCHGVISALTILYVLDAMYQNYNPDRKREDTWELECNWNQDNFETHIVSACSAIFVHNLDAEWFVKTRINRTKAPLAFLLVLADCLQEWERPSENNHTGFPASSFKIEADRERLVFHADIPAEKKTKVMTSIETRLEVPIVSIR
jgi:hypothetical protein